MLSGLDSSGYTLHKGRLKSRRVPRWAGRMVAFFLVSCLSAHLFYVEAMKCTPH